MKVIDSAWNPSNSITLYPGQLTDLTEVKCSLPESPVNIGDYGNEGVTAAGLRIAISNNGINASTDSMVFITYDSVCQECNTTTIKCRLKVCIIDTVLMYHFSLYWMVNPIAHSLPPKPSFPTYQ